MFNKHTFSKERETRYSSRGIMNASVVYTNPYEMYSNFLSVKIFPNPYVIATTRE